MIHALTVDVEEYYCAFARTWLGIDREPTEAVVHNTHRVLDLLDRFGVKGTFFFLGEVAAAYPDLVRAVADGGHELGVHGYRHRQVFDLTRDEFREEILSTRARIEEATGVVALGHRAPVFSIVPRSAWALDVLAEEGFRYDSSVFPFAGSRYGWPGFPRDIHEMSLPGGGHIVEAPMATVSVLGKAVPACGGGYLRHFPYAFTRWAMGRIGRVRPVISYMHPYEFDTDPPPTWFSDALDKADSATKRLHKRLIRNCPTVGKKVARLLGTFQFTSLREVIATVLGDGS